MRGMIASSILICAVLFWQEACGQVRVTRSPVESLRIHENYLINFKKTVTEERINRFLTTLATKSNRSRNFNAEILTKFLSIKCITARLSDKALAWVTRRRIVLDVKENEYILLGSEINPSPHTEEGWHLDRLDQPSLPLDHKKFATNFSGKNVDVYVLDTGIDYEHFVFDGRAHYPGFDPVDKFYNQNQKGRDCGIGHGTHVAGLVGGKGTGVARGVTLFSVRVLNCTGAATDVTIIEGLTQVVEHRKKRKDTRAVINLSLATTGSQVGMDRALQNALDNNITIVAAAGNGKWDFASINYNSCKAYPASYPGVVNVGATDMHDNALMGEFDGRTLYTNMGKCLDVFAPGYNIQSSTICPPKPPCPCHSRACRKIEDGTSQSCGIVSGAVALLLEKCPHLTSIEIKNMLRHVLSVNEVKIVDKALTFLCNKKPLFGEEKKKNDELIDIVLSSRDSLLHLDFTRVNCSMFHGRPLL